ncbi:ATP-dependent (S)-NAD(P)H-hydrate dehydratase isoform X2 [Tripterygium wilfordii]|uniref:ATP-dependent (S)-NAD(P)H-hydrate dehydratase isoform X2 n=1 Tax=Tripterygium wilfordii TaxID=458696 RepID=UPI0018F7E5B1|nr:ATP-dependent (S)-NAD(P)H-hydrate dehydratase isoform X2 [Tripterygium wilfordii]
MPIYCPTLLPKNHLPENLPFLPPHVGMNRFPSLNTAKTCTLASSAVLRRQQFLIRALLGGHRDHTHQKIRMQGLSSATGTNSDVDSESILRAITPVLDQSRHKGQAGKVAVIGGCREYTGAPYFAAISALKIGADLSHVFCTKDAAPVIKSYSPELIVHPILEESYSISTFEEKDRRHLLAEVIGEVDKWMERFDCLIVGPGLGRDPFLLDGLFLVTNNVDLIRGYPLAVLTPNVNEYKRLVQKVLSCEVDDQDAQEQLLGLAKQLGGVTILRKGKSDLISDGEIVKSVSIYGSPRRCGGQGDILSGSVAVFVSWARQHAIAEGNLDISPKNPTVMGCIAGSALLRKAASLAFASKKRSTLTGDIIEFLGRSLEDVCPAV